MKRTVIGFGPWILFWVFVGLGAPVAAGLAGLASALAVCAWDLTRGRPAPVELTAVLFFAAHAITTVVLGFDLFTRLGPLLSSAALAVMAWGTLAAGAPFTLRYAREQTPPALWDSPLFLSTNAIITAVWAVAFTVNTGLGVLVARRPALAVWIGGVLVHVIIAGAVVFSAVFPRRYPRWRIARDLRARDPYRWPAPAFSGPRAGDDVIVVGSGIGGLTAAALLARRGLRVSVFEQHYLPGGFCTSWPRLVRRGDTRLRYVFDAGVHDVSGLGPRGAVRRLLRALDIEDRIEWRRMTQEYVLPGLRLTVPHDPREFAALLAGHFPAEREPLAAFFAEMEAVYRELYADVDSAGGVPRPPSTVDEVLAYPSRHPHAFRWMDVRFGAMLDSFFRDVQLKAVLSALTGYLSDDPTRLTALSMAPIFGYYFDGGYYPVGSSQALADALVEVVQRHGGRVCLRAPVRAIRVENGRAVGVDLPGGRFVPARAVVSNADSRRTFLDLVGARHLPAGFVQRVRSARPSTSAAAVFLGLDMVPDIAPITLVGDAGRGVGIAVPSRVDPSLAPAGHSSVTLVTLVPPRRGGEWDRTAPDYGRSKRALGDELIAHAERVIPGLRDHIVYRQDSTPATFERYAWTSGGAIYGPAVGEWVPPARSPVGNLVLAGAGAFPGAGVEAVVISGTIAADALHPARGTPSAAPAAAATDRLALAGAAPVTPRGRRPA